MRVWLASIGVAPYLGDDLTVVVTPKTQLLRAHGDRFRAHRPRRHPARRPRARDRRRSTAACPTQPVFTAKRVVASTRRGTRPDQVVRLPRPGQVGRRHRRHDRRPAAASSPAACGTSSASGPPSWSPPNARIFTWRSGKPVVLTLADLAAGEHVLAQGSIDRSVPAAPVFTIKWMRVWEPSRLPETAVEVRRARRLEPPRPPRPPRARGVVVASPRPGGRASSAAALEARPPSGRYTEPDGSPARSFARPVRRLAAPAHRRRCCSCCWPRRSPRATGSRSSRTPSTTSTPSSTCPTTTSSSTTPAGTTGTWASTPTRNHPGVPGAIAHPRFDTHQISGYIYPPTLLPVYGALAALHLRRRPPRLAGHHPERLRAARRRGRVGHAGPPARGAGRHACCSRWPRTRSSTTCTTGRSTWSRPPSPISGFLLYPRWRGWPSAALLALAVATKVTPVLILAVMVVYFRDWRLALKALVCGLAAAGRVARLGPRRPVPRVPVHHAALDRRLRPVAVQPDGAALLVEVPARAQDGLGAGLPGAAVPGLRGEPQPATRRRSAPTTSSRSGASATPCCCSPSCSCCSSRRSPGRWPTSGRSCRWRSCSPLARRPGDRRRWSTLGIAAALLCSRIFDVRVLDLLNVLGAAVAMLALMRWYLPLEQAATVAVRRPSRPRRLVAAAAAEPAGVDPPAPTSS